MPLLNPASRKSREEIRRSQDLAKGRHGVTIMEHGKEVTYRFLHSFHATDIPTSISRNSLTEAIYKLMLKHSNDALVIMRGEDLLPLMTLKNGQVYDPRNWHIGSIVVMAGKIGMSPVLKFVSATNDFLLPEMPYHHNSPPRNYYAFFVEVFREFQLSQLNKLTQG